MCRLLQGHPSVLFCQGHVFAKLLVIKFFLTTPSHALIGVYLIHMKTEPQHSMLKLILVWVWDTHKNTSAFNLRFFSQCFWMEVIPALTSKCVVRWMNGSIPDQLDEPGGGQHMVTRHSIWHLKHIVAWICPLPSGPSSRIWTCGCWLHV